MSAAIALLLVVLGSEVKELTVAVSLIAVPAGVPAVTFRITGKLAVPAAKLGIVPAFPAIGVVQDHPVGNGVSEKKVVFAGVVSVKVAVVAALGPLLVTTCV